MNETQLCPRECPAEEHRHENKLLHTNVIIKQHGDPTQPPALPVMTLGGKHVTVEDTETQGRRPKAEVTAEGAGG